jgi:hypothetical protein
MTPKEWSLYHLGRAEAFDEAYKLIVHGNTARDVADGLSVRVQQEMQKVERHTAPSPTLRFMESAR